MKSRRRLFAMLFVSAVMLVSEPHGAIASPELRKIAILTSVMEATLATTSLVGQKSNRKIERFLWSLDFSDRDWEIYGSGLTGGQKFYFNISGYFWGADKESWVVTYSGSGAWSREPMHISGKAEWNYDVNQADHKTMNFQHSVKFGSKSTWGWVAAAEGFVGGTIGAGGAVAATIAGTGGLGIGLSAWVGASGALFGSAALVGMSAAIHSMTDSDKPVVPPAVPERPAVPKDSEKLEPLDGRIYTAVARDGRIRGSGPSGRLLLVGRFNEKVGSAKGTVSAINR